MDEIEIIYKHYEDTFSIVSEREKKRDWVCTKVRVNANLISKIYPQYPGKAIEFGITANRLKSPFPVSP